MMFLAGAGYESDPRYAWAAEILSDPETRDPAARLRKLQAAATSWIGRTLEIIRDRPSRRL